MSAPRALVCSHYIPQPDLDSYSRRLHHLVGCLRDAGWEVSCVARSPRGEELHGRRLRAAGVAVAAGFADHADNVRRAALEAPCALALLGFWNFAEPLVRLLREISPATRLVVDSGDLHFLREARRLLRGAPRSLDRLPPEFGTAMAREIGVYHAADAVLAVSAKEADLVADLIGDRRRVHVVPDGEDLAPSPLGPAERRGLFFVGNFEHPPNEEALRFLCGAVLPRLGPGLLSAHPLFVAGSNLTDGVRALAAATGGVRLVGWVPRVEPYFERVRVSLLPVLHGAGTKRKLIQALATGTPTVSTTVGIEGFAIGDGDGVLVADDALSFAEAVARLLTDDVLWTSVAGRARERVLRDHSGAVVRDRFLAAVAAVCGAGPGAGVVAVPPERPAADPAIPVELPTGTTRRPGPRATERPEISVVIPTRDRAALLDESLASLAAQDDVAGRYEVIVVDDGSTDETAAVCRRWAERLPLEVVGSSPAGIAAAKNLGVAAAGAPIVLFFDDDDVAAPDLLARHLAAHRRHPLEQVAVLGHTDWAPRLEVTEVMRYVTEIGCYLFGYPHLRDGGRYDWRFFWGGRSSCKRSLLVAAGGFRRMFTFGSEDIEAAYRMSRWLAWHRSPVGTAPADAVGLVVIYDRGARQQMIRALTYADFCRRCERQGVSQWQFAGVSTDPVVAEWCGTVDAVRRWEAVRDELPGRVARVRELEAEVGAGHVDPARRAELHRLYGWTFDAFKLKGIVTAAEHGA